MKRTCAIIAISLALAACSSLSIENYDKLKIGMSYEQVSEIIGDTEGCNEQLGARTCTWGDEKKQIKVVFVAGRATLFSHKGLD